jgi:ankyrin repeat protein
MKVIYCIILFSLVLFRSHGYYSQKILNAIKDGDLEYVEMWLMDEENGNQKFDKTNSDGELRSLHVIEYAGIFNQFEILKLFIQEKDRFNLYDEWISDALSSNIQNCDIETVKLLLNSGANVNNMCKTCRNAAPVAIALAYNCFDIYKLLYSKGAKLVNENAGYDVIHAASGSDSLELLKDLVENNGLDIHQKSNLSQASAVFYAASKGKLENIKYLVESGAKLNDLDKDGESILHYTINLEVFKYLENELIKKGVFSIEELDNKSPILISIIQKENKDLFDYFISNYKNEKIIRKNDSEGRSALFYLLNLKENKKHFFEQLTKRNLDISQKDKYGKDLKWYAKKRKDKELLELIKAYKKSH